MTSIITPTLNCYPFLTETLRSVETQSVQPEEHLIVDGGSVDGTWETALAYCRRVGFARAYKHPGLGQAAAINKGVDLARGEIAAWINGDDTYEPRAIELAEAAFRATAEAGVVYGACAIVDNDGELLYVAETSPFDRDRLLNVQNFVAQPAAFFRRNEFLSVGGLKPSLDYCMDYDLWLELSARCQFVPIQPILARFRLHDRSKTCQRQYRFHIQHLRASLRHGGTWRSPLVRNSIKFVAKEPLRRLSTRLGLRDPLASFVPGATK